jgi:tetratricopeptide (TPR) repeat protein
MSPSKSKKVTEAPAPEEIIEPEDLYEFELERYRASLKRDREQAMKRYGLTLFHSLDNCEKIEMLKELGFQLAEPEDDYNEGVVAYESGDYKRARELFEKAYKAKEDLISALCNLALTFEKLGNIDKAVNAWKQFLEHPKASKKDKAEVEKHLKELK